MTTKYWAVQWDVAGVNQTTTHSSREEAEAEAKRIATRYPDRVIFVLEAVNAWVVRCPKPELVPLTAPPTGTATASRSTRTTGKTRTNNATETIGNLTAN